MGANMLPMIREFAVADLLVDQHNPRFAPTTSQREAIRMLLADEPPKLLNLAEDIATTGRLNPLELPCVVMEHGDPVTVEGNRRLAALKLLRNPNLAASASEIAAIKKIAAIGKGPDRVSCDVAVSREEARHWIELRHTGENLGAGIKPWSAEQANRFRRDRNSQADKASRFCDAVLQEFPDDHALAADIAVARKARLTTVGRLVADPTVAHAFGFKFVDDDVVFEFDPDDLIEGIRKIFRDMSAKTASVTSIKNKQQRVDYVSKSATVIPDPGKRLAIPRLPGTGATPSGGGKGKGSKGKKKSTSSTPPKPESVIFEGLKLSRLSLRTQDVLKASQKLLIDDYTPVSAVMLRVLIEMVVTEVGVGKGWFTEGEKFAKKIRKCLLVLDPECENPTKRDKALEAAWTGSQSGSGGGVAVEQMHSYVHNFMGHPSAADLRTHSLNFRPLLEGLDAHVAVNP